MEISEITIKKFKGIEEISLGPIRPVNVLIGRNNSGKTSVLTCIQMLNSYLSHLESHHEASMTVPADCFNKGAIEKPFFEISVTVVQTKEEREKQITDLARAWDRQYTSPKTSSNKIMVQLQRNLFGCLTFEFRALEGSNKFGLVAISTVDENDVERKDARVVVAQNPEPTGHLNGLPLLELFLDTRSIRTELNTLSNLRGQGPDQSLEVNYAGPRFDAPNLRTGVQLLNPAFQYVWQAFQSAFLVSPYRHGASVLQPTRAKVMEESGRNLVNYMHDLNLNNYDAFREIAGFVKRIVPDVGRLHPRFVRAEGSELELAYEWPDGRVVNLANMGGGVEQLLILGSILIRQKTSCILWEEPESHLHPGAQDVLLSELEKHVGDSTVFIATHSPVFVRGSDKIAVHTITNRDGKSGIGRTLSVNDLQEAVGILGSRPGHLAQADIVLYVEGKYGAVVVEEWLKKWPRKNDILGHLLLVVQACNPDEMGTEDCDLEKLKKVTPNMLLFVDKDNEPGSNEPKPGRKKLREMCDAMGIPCVITKKRQIEDYFTQAAVAKSLPANLKSGWSYDSEKPMGDQLGKGWKKYNVKIAAAMEWADVEKHDDIIQLLEKVGEYAQVLTPEIEQDGS